MASLPNNYLHRLWRKPEANENTKVMKYITRYNFSNRRKFYTLKKGSAKELTHTSLMRTFFCSLHTFVCTLQQGTYDRLDKQSHQV